MIVIIVQGFCAKNGQQVLKCHQKFFDENGLEIFGNSFYNDGI